MKTLSEIVVKRGDDTKTLPWGVTEDDVLASLAEWFADTPDVYQNIVEGASELIARGLATYNEFIPYALFLEIGVEYR